MARPARVGRQQLIGSAGVLDLVHDHGQQLRFNPVPQMRQSRDLRRGPEPRLHPGPAAICGAVYSGSRSHLPVHIGIECARVDAVLPQRLHKQSFAKLQHSLRLLVFAAA
ncbi:hypothetical protein D3C73_1141180 [compost metagenome]